MRILVTGACGFIGSHLVDQLAFSGHKDIVGIDDCSVGTERPPVATLMRGGVRKCLHALRHDADGFDAIYHLAARVGVGQVIRDPLRMLEEHVRDGLAIIKAAERWHARLLFTSTSEVYGDSAAPPFAEMDTMRIGPPEVARSGYAVSKAFLEAAVIAASRQRGVPAVVVRLFNVTGPRQRALLGCVVPTWAKATLSGETIAVHGGGQQTRCFTHVTDAISALIALMGSQEATGHVVNIGQDSPITIRQAAEDLTTYCRTTYGVPGLIEHVPFTALDPQAGWERMHIRVPDVQRLAQFTGLRFTNRWPEIVRETCDYWAAKLGVKKIGGVDAG